MAAHGMASCHERWVCVGKLWGVCNKSGMLRAFWMLPKRKEEKKKKWLTD